MFITTISPLDLESRVDAEYYAPEALKCLKQVRSFNEHDSLGAIITQGYRVVYHGKDNTNDLEKEQKLPFLSPSQIDKNGNIDFEKVDELPLYYKDKYPKGLAQSDELLIEVKGNVSKLAIVPKSFPKNLMVSGSLYKAKISVDYDSRFILSFLKCKHGQILKSRLTSNTIISYIAKDDLYSIPVFKINKLAQVYIGNKVRQLELLRKWSLETIETLKEFFKQNYEPIKIYNSNKKKYYYLQSKSFCDVMTPESYPPHIDEYFNNHEGFTLGELASEIFIGNTIPNTDEDEYILQATSRSCSGLYLKQGMNKVSRPESGKYLNKKDLLLTCAAHDKRYIGKDVSIHHSDNIVMPSAKVLTIRLKPNTLPVSYVHNYLMSPEGYTQWQSIVRGITAGIQPTDVARIRIPKPLETIKSNAQFGKADDEYLKAGLATELATYLSVTSTFLVESLIEGQITEYQLNEAQQALEEGDNSKDRAILSKVTDKGYLAEGGKPLFDDLDKLYELLDEAKVAMDVDGELV
jgi:type I restriction enzyme S subunit